MLDFLSFLIRHKSGRKSADITETDPKNIVIFERSDVISKIKLVREQSGG